MPRCDHTQLLLLFLFLATFHNFPSICSSSFLLLSSPFPLLPTFPLCSLSLPFSSSLPPFSYFYCFLSVLPCSFLFHPLLHHLSCLCLTSYHGLISSIYVYPGFFIYFKTSVEKRLRLRKIIFFFFFKISVH